jgi:hypothetical protein
MTRAGTGESEEEARKVTSSCALDVPYFARDLHPRLLSRLAGQLG